jgi:hypothetical protein
MANRYLVLLKFLANLNSHLVFEFEGKIKLSQLLSYNRNEALLKCLQILIEGGVDKEGETSYGMTALEVAASVGNQQVVCYLLDQAPILNLFSSQHQHMNIKGVKTIGIMTHSIRTKTRYYA